MPDTPQQQRPSCQKCRHFFITWEPAHPYGCRAIGFKSAKTPALAVYENSGIECQLFAAKTSADKKQ